MFSATFSKDIKKLAIGILHKPVSVELHQKTLLFAITQKVYPVAREKNRINY
jgi:ATP-dependent RNA helicase RhlE